MNEEKRKQGRPKGAKAKAPRPPETLKSKIVSVRFCQSEWTAIVEMAARNRLRVSDFIRRKVLA